MKQFKFGNPPTYINKTPIRRAQQAQPPAEKSAPASKNQMQARPRPTPAPPPSSNTPVASPVVSQQVQANIQDRQKNLVQSQKAVIPKFSPQQNLLKSNVNVASPAAKIQPPNQPQLLKTPAENTRINLGVIDPPVPPITAKIVKAKIPEKVVKNNASKEPQGFKTKVQKKIDEENQKQIRNNKAISAKRAAQNKQSFTAVIEERPRRVSTEVNSALSTVNGLGGWRL